jgi:hypothetical protein
MIPHTIDAEVIPKQFLKDNQRSAFGLGYEFNRRGRPLDDNPFPVDRWEHKEFCDGWKAKERIKRDMD